MTHGSSLFWANICVALALAINVYLMATQIAAIRKLRRTNRDCRNLLDRMIHDMRQPP